MDAAPPPAPVYLEAASDERPRSPRERDLCDRASHFDWLYFAAPLLTEAAAIFVDSTYLKNSTLPGWTYLGSGLVGLGWGFTLGSLYPALPKCSADWVGSAPIEGDVRTDWHLGVAFGIAAAVSAPIVVGIEAGPIPPWNTNGERALRVGFGALGGAVGAVLPYLLPPKTWRAARELQRLRAGVDAAGRGAFVGYSFSF